MDESSGDRNPVERLFEDFLARKRRGDHPRMEEYLAAHPDWADDIRELFPALLLMENFKPETAELNDDTEENSHIRRDALPEQVGDYRIVSEIGRGGMGVVYEAEQLSLGRRVALKVLRRSLADEPHALERFQREARSAARLHHTNIVPVFEVGVEQDISYYAMQYIHGQGLDQVLTELVNLRSGAHAVSAAESPAISLVTLSLCRGIFPASEVAEPTALIEQQDPDQLAAALPRRPRQKGRDSGNAGDGERSDIKLPGSSELSVIHSGRQQYFRSISHVGWQVADALAYAHGRGVVHRDIKPSNLLLDTSGVVWITDFGLAKAEEDNLTRTGNIVGTLRYMAPERFSGESDAGVDVYGLGATLYELITLQPAFETTDRLRLIDKIANSEPARPRTIDPSIPRDLETIVLKAMEKSPKARYASAAALAEDLRRFANDEPIAVRRPLAVERFARWARHNRSLAASLSAVAVLLVVFAAAGWIYGGKMGMLKTDAESAARREKHAADRERSARAQADRLRSVAEQATEHMRRLYYFSDMHRAQQAWEQGNLATVKLLLERHRPAPGETDLRGFEWYRLWSLFQRVNDAPLLDELGIPLQFLTTGEVAGLRNDRVRIADIGTREITSETTVPGACGISSDGQRVLCMRRAGQQVVVHERLSRTDRVLGDNLLAVRAAAISPDGARVAIRTEDAKLTLLDAVTGEVVSKCDGPPLADRSTNDLLVFSPDGTRVAVGRSGNDLTVWHVQTGELRAFRGHYARRSYDEGILAIAFSTDGTRVATGGEDQTIRVWDVDTGNVIAVLTGHTKEICSLAFAPHDNELVASGARDHTVRIWNVPRSQELAVLKGHYGEVGAVAFSLDGRTLVSAAYPRQEALLWDVAAWIHTEVLWCDGGWNDLAANSTGSLIAVAAHENTRVLFWNRNERGTPGDRQQLEIGAPIGAIAVSNSGLLAVARADHVVEIWEIESCQLKESFVLDKDEVVATSSHCLEFSPDGSCLAMGCTNGVVRLRNIGKAGTGVVLGTISHACAYLDFDSSGQRLVVGNSITGGITTWNTHTREELWSSWGGAKPTFSPNGKLIASSTYGDRYGGTTQLLDAETGIRLKSLGRQRSISGNAFLDDNTIVTIGWDSVLNLWDINYGQHRCALEEHAGGCSDLLVTSDGTSILSVDRSGMIRIWRGQRGVENSRNAMSPPADPVDVHENDRGQMSTVFPHRAVECIHRAQAAAISGDWASAATLLKEASPGLDTDVELCWARGAAQLRAGDVEAYIATCKQALESFDRTGGFDRNVYPMWEMIIHLCLLTENDTWSDGRLETLFRNIPADAQDVYLRLARGRYLLRTGQPALALEALPQPPAGNDWECPASHFSLALAHHALGHEKDARRFCTLGSVEMALRLPSPQKGRVSHNAPPRWALWATLDYMRRETGQIIWGKEFQVHDALHQALAAGDTAKAVPLIDKVLDIEPDNVEMLRMRGAIYAQLGAWREAAADLQHLIQIDPHDTMDWLRVTSALLMAGQHTHYRDHCRSMLERFRDSDDIGDVERCIKASLLADDELVVATLPVNRLTETVNADTTSEWFRPWGQLALGLAQYRRHQPQEMMRQIEAIRKSIAYTTQPHLKSATEMMAALALLDLGDKVQAKEAYQKAADLVETGMSDLAGPDWHDAVIAELLRREAKKKLDRDR